MKPYLLGAGEGLAGATEQSSDMIIKATAELTGGALGLLESSDPPHFSTILHRHEAAELWYILDGHYDYYADGEWLSAEAGGVVFVPGGLPHGLRVGAAGGRKLTLFVPGGAEGFFHEMHQAIESDGLTAEIAAAIYEQYGMQRLGPLPDRE